MTDVSKKLLTQEYDFLRTNTHLGNRIAFLVLSGSYAHGTNTASSDIDLRGFSLETPKELIGLSSFEQVVERNSDTTIFAFNKFFTLLMACNTNALEMMGTRPEEIIYLSPIAQMLLNNKSLFLNQRVKFSFGEYAKERLYKLIYILTKQSGELTKQQNLLIDNLNRKSEKLQSENPFGDLRFYSNNDSILIDTKVKGGSPEVVFSVFRELQQMYSGQLKSFSNHQEKDDIHINKHAGHIIRLYCMGTEILQTGEIHTYREKEHDLLMSVKNGEFQKSDGQYRDEFFDLVNELAEKFNYAAEHTCLPINQDKKKLEDLKVEINRKILLEY